MAGSYPLCVRKVISMKLALWITNIAYLPANDIKGSVGCQLPHHERQMRYHWRLYVDYFYCNHHSSVMLELKLNHLSKRGPRYMWHKYGGISICLMFYMTYVLLSAI